MAHEADREYRRTDDAATIEFRTYTKAALDSLEKGQNLLRDCFEKIQKVFLEDKKEIEERVDDHQDRLTKIETSLGIMVKVTWVIVGCSISVVVAEIYKIILK